MILSLALPLFAPAIAVPLALPLALPLLGSPAFDPGPSAAGLPEAYAQAEGVWRPFFESRLGRRAIEAALGKPDEVVVMDDGVAELFWRKLPAFPAGVSVYLGPGDLCQDATFYVAPVGPVWTGASKRAASRVSGPIAMDALPARYGKPDRDLAGTGRRVGIRRLVYEAGGEATRSVTFFSLPYATGLHYLRVSHDE